MIVPAAFVVIAFLTSVALGWRDGGTWFVFVVLVVGGFYMMGIFG